MAAPVRILPDERDPRLARPAKRNSGELISNRPFRRLLLVAGLVIGSQAMADAFAVIQWRAAGISTGLISLLWSKAVLSEVLVFLLLGNVILRRIGPAGSATVSALAGIAQWASLAKTSSPACSRSPSCCTA